MEKERFYQIYPKNIFLKGFEWIFNASQPFQKRKLQKMSKTIYLNFI